MNDKTGGSRGPRRAAALAVVAALAVLATACGGGTSSATSSASANSQKLALAQCMRSHGVPDFPDPAASGGYTLTSNGSIEGAGGSSIDIGSRQAPGAGNRHKPSVPGCCQCQLTPRRPQVTRLASGSSPPMHWGRESSARRGCACTARGQAPARRSARWLRTRQSRRARYAPRRTPPPARRRLRRQPGRPRAAGPGYRRSCGSSLPPHRAGTGLSATTCCREWEVTAR